MVWPTPASKRATPKIVKQQTRSTEEPSNQQGECIQTTKRNQWARKGPLSDQPVAQKRESASPRRPKNIKRHNHNRRDPDPRTSESLSCQKARHPLPPRDRKCRDSTPLGCGPDKSASLRFVCSLNHGGNSCVYVPLWSNDSREAREEMTGIIQSASPTNGLRKHHKRHDVVSSSPLPSWGTAALRKMGSCRCATSQKDPILWKY
mmetsp:Transcript_6659/g.15169  ORF Transcript_6659/g.15169 Transcript_6659/m.15169 type:complete len:205 (+) Transcript_6659:1265-1879(+)